MGRRPSEEVIDEFSVSLVHLLFTLPSKLGDAILLPLRGEALLCLTAFVNVRLFAFLGQSVLIVLVLVPLLLQLLLLQQQLLSLLVLELLLELLLLSLLILELLYPSLLGKPIARHSATSCVHHDPTPWCSTIQEFPGFTFHLLFILAFEPSRLLPLEVQGVDGVA